MREWMVPQAGTLLRLMHEPAFGREGKASRSRPLRSCGGELLVHGNGHIKAMPLCSQLPGDTQSSKGKENKLLRRLGQRSNSGVRRPDLTIH